MSRMPVFGPGPGQYQSQTTFNPALQPTIQVEQQQSLFAQIAGMVPAVAESAANVINVQTKAKEQDFIEREAIAKNQAVQGGDLGLLESFYRNELNKEGFIPRSIKVQATEGATTVVQMQQKLASEYQQQEQKRLEEFDKQQKALEKQNITIGVERNITSAKVESNYATSLKNLYDMLSTYRGTEHEPTILKAIQEVNSANNVYANSIVVEENRRKTEASKIATNIYGVIKDKVNSDPSLRNSIISGQIDLNDFAKELSTRLYGDIDVSNWKNGLPTNDPYLRNALLTSRGEFLEVFYSEQNGRIQEETIKKDLILLKDVSLNITATDGVKTFMEVFNALNSKAESAYTPEQKIAWQARVQSTFVDALQDISNRVVSGQLDPLVAWKTQAQLVQELTKFSPLPGSYSENLNKIDYALKNRLINNLKTSLETSYPGINSDQAMAEVIPNSIENGKPVYGKDPLTVGESFLIESMKTTGMWSDDEINRALVQGSIRYLYSNDPIKNRLVDAVVDTYDTYILPKVPKDIDGNYRSPTKIAKDIAAGNRVTTDDLNKINLPSQWINDGVVLKAEEIGIPFGWDADYVKRLASEDNPGLVNDQIKLFGYLANNDNAWLNGQDVNSNLMNHAIDNIKSSSNLRRLQGFVQLSVYGGLANTSIRDAVNGVTDVKRSLDSDTVAIIANMKSALVQNKDGDFSLKIPDGMTFETWINDIKTMTPDVTLTDKQLSEMNTVLGIPDNTVMSPKIQQFIFGLYTRELSRKTSDIKAVVTEHLNANGLVLDTNRYGATELMSNNNGTYIPEQEREGHMARWFHTYIPEPFRARYAEALGVPGIQYEYFDELLAAKLGVTLGDLYNGRNQFALEYSNTMQNIVMKDDNGNIIKDADGTNPVHSFALGGHLIFYNEETKKWNGIYIKDPITGAEVPMRMSPKHTLRFSIMGAPETAEFFLPPEEQTKDTFGFVRTYPETWFPRLARAPVNQFMSGIEGVRTAAGMGRRVINFVAKDIIPPNLGATVDRRFIKVQETTDRFTTRYSVPPMYERE